MTMFERKAANKASQSRLPAAIQFEDVASADHFICRRHPDPADELNLIQYAKAGLAMYDHGTAWTDIYPQACRSAEHCQASFLQFNGPVNNIKLFYHDNAGEVVTAARNCFWRHDISTPHQPPTNSIAEAAAERVKTTARGISYKVD